MWPVAVLLVFAVVAHAADVEKDLNTVIVKALAANDKQDSDRLFQQAEQLLKVRGGGLSKVKRSRLAADILRSKGRAAARFWQRRPEDENLRHLAQRHLLKAVSEYERIHGEAKARAKLIEDRAVKAGRDYTGSRRWKELIGETTRTVYTIAWCHYALGLTADTPAQRRHYLERAVSGFKQFTDDGYHENPVITSCFLGQALCDFELEQYFKIKELLAGITLDNCPLPDFRRFTLLTMQADQAIPSHLEVESAARRYFDALPPDHAFDEVDLSMLLIRAQSLASLASPDEDPLGHAAFQPTLEQVAATLFKAGEPWASRVNALLAEAGATVQTTAPQRVRQLYQAGRFDEAYTQAEQLLQHPNEDTPDSVRADMQWISAASAANLRHWSNAFHAAFAFIRSHLDDTRAANMAAIAFDAAHRADILHTVDTTCAPVPESDFDRLVEFTKVHFSELAQLKMVPWYRASRLLAAGRYVQAYDLLEPVPADSPAYLQALYGRAFAALKAHQALASNPSDPSPTDPTETGHAWLDKASRAVSDFIRTESAKAAGHEPDLTGEIVTLTIAIAQAWLSLTPPDAGSAAAMLQQLHRWPPAADEHTAAQLALRLEADTLIGPSSTLRSLLTPSKSAADTPSVRIKAMLILADRLEWQHTRLPADTGLSKGILESLIEVYGYLIGHDRDDHDPADVLRWRRRLARALRRLGRYREAIDQYQVVLDQLPHEKSADVTREMALSYEAIKDCEHALALWRELTKGLASHTDPWYEAKYHLIVCHDKLGHHDHARQLLQYLRLRMNDATPDPWRRRFDELHQRWETHNP